MYHFIRCPCVAFIFKLPPAFGTLHAPFFSSSTLAKLAVFFETYYIVSKQFGQAFLKSAFPFRANKISGIAKHVAIKNKILHLSHIHNISYDQAQEFCTRRKSPAYFYPNTLDAACM